MIEWVIERVAARGEAARCLQRCWCVCGTTEEEVSDTCSNPAAPTALLTGRSIMTLPGNVPPSLVQSERRAKGDERGGGGVQRERCTTN